MSSVDIPSLPQSGPAAQRAGKPELELDVGGRGIKVQGFEVLGLQGVYGFEL